MDFLLKKFISMFLMPLPLGVFFIVLALVLLYRDKTKPAKFMLTLSILWLFFFSYPPISNTLLYSLESNTPTLHKAPENIKYIYVLGGGHHTDMNLPITSQILEASVVRLNEGIRLYHQLDEEASIIVSGYSGLFDPTTHAVMQKKLALALGVKQEKIILRPEPRDTEEEAIAAKTLLGERPFILVTSASHMTRALKFFKNKGLNPIPAPTNHLASTQHLDYTKFFSSGALEKSRIVFHEILGLIWQKVKGI
ncbi:envelope biogenesis factor ElyC [Sulfurovum sp. XTW-4]|uniref:Envelope biogenesis factor ElyC n=1 Tax=Sulfurovum xiamenensis TaxID=3019066 RepID=A0ABT7QTY1_9BACT|nr:envelope biogenesis factor ElyC [Sulfurovum xiamenensis]MDM5264533.1 envelope biogenesis factor ElyC [Sulfurovum xiamenensis]